MAGKADSPGSSCDWSLRTVERTKQIVLSFSVRNTQKHLFNRHILCQDVVFAGDCSDNYIEVKTGGSPGRVIKKFCSTNQPSGSLKTFASQVYVTFVKGSLTSSFTGTWSTEAVVCCSKVVLENHANRNGEYEWSAADTAYKQSAGTELLYSKSFSEGPGWWVGPDKTVRGIYTLVSLTTIV